MRHDEASLRQLGYVLVGNCAVQRLAERSQGPEGLEETLLAQIRKLAKTTGWLLYHTYNSQRSEKGFPDLVLAKHGRLIFAELKSKKGKESDDQMRWLSILQHTLPELEVYTWRPADWSTIVEILTTGHPGARHE